MFVMCVENFSSDVKDKKEAPLVYCHILVHVVSYTGASIWSSWLCPRPDKVQKRRRRRRPEKTGSSGPRACEQCKSPVCTLCNLRPDKKEYREWPRVRKDGTEEPYSFVCMSLNMVVDGIKADGQYKYEKTEFA